MKDVIKFCYKTITKTKQVLQNESKLKASIEREELSAIDGKIRENKEETKRLLQQTKFKKFFVTETHFKPSFHSQIKKIK